MRLLTFMRSALNAMGRNALIDELIVVVSRAWVPCRRPPPG